MGANGGERPSFTVREFYAQFPFKGAGLYLMAYFSGICNGLSAGRWFWIAMGGSFGIMFIGALSTAYSKCTIAWYKRETAALVAKYPYLNHMGPN